ncbi:MAG: hypothetical protein ACFFCI_12260 [Promethearchaeota archaeon]
MIPPKSQGLSGIELLTSRLSEKSLEEERKDPAEKVDSLRSKLKE